MINIRLAQTVKLFGHTNFFLLFVLNSSFLYGQERLTLTADQKAMAASQLKRATTFSSKTLQIGDKVPDIIMTNIFNYPGGRARLSDFKGKHILLDFWSRQCSSCIGAFPKMEKIQKQFSERIQILAVCTFNTLETLTLGEPGFPKASTSLGIRETTLPLVFNSVEMADFFPHISEPYLVWIDTAGIVRAMIDSWNVDQDMILNLLNGDYDHYPLAYSFRRVKDTTMEHQEYDPEQPILTEGNGRQVNKVVYLKRLESTPSAYVILAKVGSVRQSYPIPIHDTIAGRQIGERAGGMRLMRLYQRVYPVESQLLIVESPNPGKYDRNAASVKERWDWEWNNLYSYEVVGPSEEIRTTLLRDALRDYFNNIKVIKEKRKVKCFELRRISQEEKLETKFKGRKKVMDMSSSLFAFQNFEYGLFFNYFRFFNELNHRWGKPNEFRPLYDETGYSAEKKIDIVLRDLKNISGLDAQLRRYGLTLHETDRLVDVVVLKESAVL